MLQLRNNISLLEIFKFLVNEETRIKKYNLSNKVFSFLNSICIFIKLNYSIYVGPILGNG
jgi:hypothetical protein